MISHGSSAVPDFKALFEASPSPHVVLNPDLTIVAVNDAFLRVTMTEREAILGRYFFDVFPDNPHDPDASRVSGIRDVFERVLTTRAPETMGILRYDIQRPEKHGAGEFEERWWSPVSSPVLDASGEVRWIIHKVEDVTDLVHAKQQRARPAAPPERLRCETEEMEAELYRRGQELQTANQRLRAAYEAVERKERERAELYEQIVQGSEDREMYRLLAGRLQEVREEHRAVLARELHDELGQELTGAKIDLNNAIQRIQGGDSEAALSRLKEVSAAVDEVIRAVRRIAADLRPPLLDQIGLAPAVEAHAKELEKRSGIQMAVEAPSVRIPLTSQQRMALFRIVQESLTNAVRHSKATHARITIQQTATAVTVIVRDDGIGFRRTGRSLGLLGMEERAALIGANLSVESTPGSGTTITVTLPRKQP